MFEFWLSEFSRIKIAASVAPEIQQNCSTQYRPPEIQLVEKCLELALFLLGCLD